jgi:uracil-DNA glycosylase family 4
VRTLALYEEVPRLRVETTLPLTLDRSCTRCVLGKRDGIQSRCMSAAGVGTQGPTLYVLGAGPTQQEDRTGMPFSGAAGTYVRQQIALHWKGSVVYDNALRCSLGRDAPKPQAIAACRPYLAQVWSESGADRVLLIGREAMTAFIGEGHAPLSVRRGYTHTATGVPVFLLMPSSLPVRNRFWRGWFEEDVQWALTADPDMGPRHTGRVFQVQTEQDLQEAFEDLEIAPWVTLDTETYGAAWNREARILDVALTPGGQDYAYSLPREAVDRLGPQLVAGLSKLRLVGHALKHDQVFLWARFGRRLECWADSMWLRRYFEGGVELALEHAQTQVGMSGGKEEAWAYVTAGAAALRKEVKGPGKRATKTLPTDWWHSSPDRQQNMAEREMAVERVREGDEPMRYAYAAIPPDVRARYNGLDTVSSDRVCRIYRARQDEDAKRSWRVWNEIGRDMQHAMMVMEGNGVAVDRAKIHELIALMDTDIAEIEAQVEAAYPEAEYGRFNFHSGSPDTARLLFDVRGLPSKQLTPTGRRQCNAEVLEKLDDPFATMVVKWRQRQHFKAQYGEGMLVAIQDDGRIHTSIKGVGAETGRPSSEDPNLFNLPRSDTGSGHGKMCRDVLIATPTPPDDPDPWVLIEADQSQIELRVAAMLSGDQKMIQAYKDGINVHTAAAKMTAPYVKLRPEDIHDDHPHRSNTKAVVFGALYGEPDVSLAKKLGISRATAAKLQQLILGHYDRLQAWTQEQLAFARKHGYTYTWWNGQQFRKRWLCEVGNPDQRDPARDTAERSSWNTPIQGTASDYTNASLGAIQRWIERKWPDWRTAQVRSVLTVYDSILLESRRSQVRRTAAEVKRIMESWPTLHGMPLKADVKVGQRFGSLGKYKADEWPDG